MTQPTTQVVEILTLRQQKARERIEGWTRKYFTEQHLKVVRETARSWENLVIEIWSESGGKKFSDYLFDPGTGKPILISGEPWNHHQMWVLAYIKKFMSRKPKPLRQELKQHLLVNADLLTHKNFLEEFNRK